MMRWIYKLPLRLRSLLRKTRVEQELSQELRFHLEKLIEQNVSNGMAPEDARYAALRELGGVEQIKEECRDMRRINYIESFLQDVRYGLRQLRRNPSFTAVAVITLALGIGSNTAIFSVVNAVLLHPLPYKDPGQLVLIMERLPTITPKPIPLPAPDVVEFQRESRTFQNVAGFQSIHMELSGGEQPQRISAARVSSTLFPLLGVPPLLGRTFSTNEDQPGRLAAVLSYGLWQRRFGGDRSALGNTVILNRKPYSIVGIMPPDFKFPLEGLLGGNPADLWVPMGFTPDELSDVGDNFDYGAIAQLKAGVTLPQADADVGAIARHILDQYPASVRNQFQLSAVCVPLRQIAVGRARPLVVVLMVAVGLVLLIATVNVANLLLARGADRQKEMGIRIALGAGRARLFRQLMSESVLLGLAGGACGLLVASWGARLLVSLVPVSMPHAGDFSLDSRVLGFTLAISVLTAVLFGLVPGLAATRTTLNETLKEGGRSSGQGHRHHQLRGMLVITETALALMLLISAGLLIRSFLRLLDTTTGFDTQHVLTLTLDLPQAKYQSGSQVVSFYQTLLERLSAVPGVQAVGAATSLPIVNTNWNHLFSVEGHQSVPGEKMPLCWHALVLGDYFQTLHIPLIRGRFFNSGDRPKSLPVVIISKSIADRYWPGQDPIGKRLKWGPPQSKSRWLTVVGVVGDVKQQKLTEHKSFHTYQSYLQVPQYWNNGLGRSMSVAVRTAGDPASLAVAAQRGVWSLDKDLAISHLETLREGLSRSMSPQRFNLILMAVFAALAVLLASIGIYGVTAFSVAQRTHESVSAWRWGHRRAMCSAWSLDRGLS
jgi:predicted permease